MESAAVGESIGYRQLNTRTLSSSFRFGLKWRQRFPGMDLFSQSRVGWMPNLWEVECGILGSGSGESVWFRICSQIRQPVKIVDVCFFGGRGSDRKLLGVMSCFGKMLQHGPLLVICPSPWWQCFIRARVVSGFPAGNEGHGRPESAQEASVSW